MDNWNVYSERITLALKELQKWQIICFGTWSVFPFTRDKKVICFLNSICETEFFNKILLFIHSCWNGKQTNKEADSIYKMLTSFEWDEDSVHMKDEDSSQGAIDFLGGVELLSKFILKNNKKDISNCAFQIFNRMDYKINFSEDNFEVKLMEILLENEKKNQLKIIEDISKTKPGDIAIELHHEELINFFSKPV
ncbi:MAG: hypothetical protein FWG14_10045 [Peptococcaceae bacterium]|nr:hypothetical protein [Peptococcaceae bacterium]